MYQLLHSIWYCTPCMARIFANRQPSLRNEQKQTACEQVLTADHFNKIELAGRSLESVRKLTEQNFVPTYTKFSVRRLNHSCMNRPNITSNFLKDKTELQTNPTELWDGKV